MEITDIDFVTRLYCGLFIIMMFNNYYLVKQIIILYFYIMLITHKDY